MLLVQAEMGAPAFGFVCIVGVSIPPFFLASSFLDVFAVRFGWISVASSTGLMRYLPAAICLAVGGIALYSQLLSKILSGR